MRMRDEDGHRAMLEAGKAWTSIKKATMRVWSQWTTVVGPGLVKARAEAMAINHVNKPGGRGYNTTMGGLLKEYKLDDMEGVARNDMIEIMNHLGDVEDWRAKQPDRSHLNHPTTVWRKFKASKEGREALGIEHAAAFKILDAASGMLSADKVAEPHDPAAVEKELRAEIERLKAELWEERNTKAGDAAERAILKNPQDVFADVLPWTRRSSSLSSKTAYVR